ncbi:hypothetical protein [Rhizobium leguminosarum]
MSRLYRPQDDYDNWWALGSIVEFNDPYGERLRGRIVRTSSNPTYFHVEVRGRRYEVDLHEDNMEMVWGDDD